MGKCECFTIDISVQQKLAPFIGLERKSILRFPKRTAWSLFYPPIMQADPFLFSYDGRLHLFFEEMLLGKGLGYIKTSSTTDLKHWTKPTIITQEPQCHFSYPFVFEHEGQVFMMPETGDDHTIRLYKADNKIKELTAFSLYKVLMQRDLLPRNLRFDYADSCMYKKDGVYYLFTSYCDDKTYYLELYVSDCFDGGYKLHPMSPVCTSNKYGRCGGSVFEYNGKLYRPTQDCETVYGGQVHLMEIDCLSPTDYKEHVAAVNVLPQDQSFYCQGGHHLNFAEFQNMTVVATDARFTTSFLLERIRQKVLKEFSRFNR